MDTGFKGEEIWEGQHCFYKPYIFQPPPQQIQTGLNKSKKANDFKVLIALIIVCCFDPHVLYVCVLYTHWYTKMRNHIDVRLLQLKGVVNYTDQSKFKQ